MHTYTYANTPPPKIKSRHVLCSHTHRLQTEPGDSARVLWVVLISDSTFRDISVLSNLFTFQPDSHHALTSHISLSLTVFSLFLTTSMKAQAPRHHSTTSSSRHLDVDMQEI